MPSGESSRRESDSIWCFELIRYRSPVSALIGFGFTAINTTGRMRDTGAYLRSKDGFEAPGVVLGQKMMLISNV